MTAKFSKIDRRTLLCGCGSGLVAVAPASAMPPQSGLPIPPGRHLAFQIMRQGRKVGEYNSHFELKDETLTIRSQAEIVVGLMGVALFRYVHHAVERWQGGTLSSVETTTNDDGTQYWVRVERKGSGLAVTGSTQAPYVAPADALAMTHWNRAELMVPKINPQKGALLRPVVTDRGVEHIASASGATIAARHFNFSGQAILDIWYDSDDQWAALAFLGGDQSQIRLERA